MPDELRLRPLLNARSVAVIGAVPPRDHAKLASKPIANMQKYGFGGRIYPVNPSYDEISGLQCYPSLDALPEVVDTAMILRRADAAAGTVRELGSFGVAGAVVCGGGFGEAGPEGQARQDDLVAAARDHGVAVCGPNTNGLLNFRSGMMLGFHPLLEADQKVPTGGISIVSHSGTVTGAIMARLRGSGLGFGYVVSAGNEAVLQAADYMHYLAADAETDTVVLYLEQVRDGEIFRRACEALRAAGKSIVALKAGASDGAAEVAFGHTGALVGSHTAFLAAARDYGIAVAQGLEELVALTRLAATGRRGSTGVVGLSMSGGLNGLMADAVDRAGGTFVPLSAPTVERLKEVVPISSPTNPFDLTGLAVDTPGMLRQVLDVLHDGTGAGDVVFSLGLMPDATWPDWSQECRAFAAERGVRISVYAASGRTPGDGYGYFERAGIAVYEAIEPLARALVSVAQAGERPRAAEAGTAPPAAPPAALPDDVPSRRSILRDWDLPYVPYAYVSTAQEAVRAAEGMGFPVAMKVAHEEIAHKAKLGLVELGVGSPQAASDAFARLQHNYDRLAGTLAALGPIRVEVQRLLPAGGLEVFLGGRVDDTFGPVVSVGLGGGLVEAIADLSSALAPLTRDDAHRLILANGGLRRALKGGRWNSERLACVVARFSEMLAGVRSIVAEVECNPVVLYQDDAWIIDDLWTARKAETR
ncbi:acetate--CoA ligase family protein [Dactylosporangium salmoneum]|uniref:Acetate--CoA ligase family protein n=1 Tax=Dactylosporangium salmoneum TaxID=53361 RepID=A0ABN3FXM9_9ACTN